MTRKQIENITKLPPVKWQAAAKKLSETERDEISRHYSSLAEWAARIAVYFGYRSGYGCSDQGHEKAVRAQNSTSTKVRRALNYTITKSNINF